MLNVMPTRASKTKAGVAWGLFLMRMRGMAPQRERRKPRTMERLRPILLRMERERKMKMISKTEESMAERYMLPGRFFR